MNNHERCHQESARLRQDLKEQEALFSKRRALIELQYQDVSNHLERALERNIELTAKCRKLKSAIFVIAGTLLFYIVIYKLTT